MANNPSEWAEWSPIISCIEIKETGNYISLNYSSFLWGISIRTDNENNPKTDAGSWDSNGGRERRRLGGGKNKSKENKITMIIIIKALMLFFLITLSLPWTPQNAIRLTFLFFLIVWYIRIWWVAGWWWALAADGLQWQHNGFNFLSLSEMVSCILLY